MAAFILLGAGHVHGQIETQVYCGSRDSVLTQLYINFQEQPRFIALTDAGNVLEVVTRDDGSTWSLISTNPTGLTCVVQTGEHWQAVVPQAPGEGS